MKTQTKTQTTKTQSAKVKTAPLVLTVANIAAQAPLVARFYANGLAYHAKAGRLNVDKAGHVHLTAEGRKYFSARPLVEAARKAQQTGEKVEAAEYVAASNWPHKYRLADKYHVAGRKDSQAAFAACLIG